MEKTSKKDKKANKSVIRRLYHRMFLRLWTHQKSLQTDSG